VEEAEVVRVIRRRFDVNDAALREEFLRADVPAALVELRADAPPRWGRMAAAQMVEHLLWAFELSTGRGRVECGVSPEDLARMRRFLYSNRPTPQDFMNPLLVSGLPPLRFADVAAAKEALGREIAAFLAGASEPQRTFVHPIFGALAYEEWHRTHYKHAHHHLAQFGLVEAE
jgi:hypothetical protein